MQVPHAINLDVQAGPAAWVAGCQWVQAVTKAITQSQKAGLHTVIQHVAEGALVVHTEV